MSGEKSIRRGDMVTMPALEGERNILIASRGDVLRVIIVIDALPYAIDLRGAQLDGFAESIAATTAKIQERRGLH